MAFREDRIISENDKFGRLTHRDDGGTCAGSRVRRGAAAMGVGLGLLLFSFGRVHAYDSEYSPLARKVTLC